MIEKRQLVLILFLTLILVACNKEKDVSDEIFNHLHNTVQVEKKFIENQEKILKLEESEQKLYNDITNLSSEDHRLIKELSIDAIELLKERHKYIEQEKESINESRMEFNEIKPLLDKIRNENQAKLANEMFDTMADRYEAYEEVYERYTESIEHTTELYLLLQEKKTSENKIFAVLTKVNNSYDDVLHATESFNDETILYNRLKEEYYELASEN